MFAGMPPATGASGVTRRARSDRSRVGVDSSALRLMITGGLGCATDVARQCRRRQIADTNHAVVDGTIGGNASSALTCPTASHAMKQTTVISATPMHDVTPLGIAAFRSTPDRHKRSARRSYREYRSY